MTVTTAGVVGVLICLIVALAARRHRRPRD
jgi:hypothetical protein